MHGFWVVVKVWVLWGFVLFVWGGGGGKFADVWVFGVREVVIGRLE